LRGEPPSSDAHHTEDVGEKRRGMMPWIKSSSALVDKTRN